MMNMKDDIIKKNLAFIYGRDHENLPDYFPSEKNKNQKHIFDPDKVVMIPNSHPMNANPLLEVDVISDFTNDYEALSPFFIVDVYLMGDPDPYPSYEHALQASKFTCKDVRNTIRSLGNVREMKNFVAKQKDVLAPEKFFQDWQQFSLTFAECLIRDKFVRNPAARQALVGTKHFKLVYKNEFNDQYWGFVEKKKVGHNHYGKLLEKIRGEIEKGTDYILWIQDHFRLVDLLDHLRLVLRTARPGPSLTEEQLAAFLHRNGSAEQQQQQQKSVEEAAEEERRYLRENAYAPEEDERLREEYSFDEKNLLLVGNYRRGGARQDAHSDHWLLLPHFSVSRHHAALFVAKGPPRERLLLVDFASRNGTFLNGQAVAPFRFVELAEDKDVVQFGSLQRLFTTSLHLDSRELKQDELYRKVVEEAGLDDDGQDGHQHQQRGDENNTVFVANLSYEAGEDDLRRFFEGCGDIASLTLPRDRKTGQSKGIAFVTFQSFSGVLQAISRDGDELRGRQVKVKKSDARKSDLAPQQPAPRRDRRDAHQTKSGSSSTTDNNHNSNRRESVPVKSEGRERERPRASSRERQGRRDADRRERSQDRGDRDRRDRRERSRSGGRRERRDSRDRDDSRGRRDERRRDDSRERRDRDYRDKDRDRDRDRDSNRDQYKDRDRDRDKDNRKRSLDASDQRRERSPPRKRRATSPSPSPSPPRRSQQQVPAVKQERRSPSASPPRRKPTTNRSPSSSPSPPRRLRAVPPVKVEPSQRPAASPSPSPPRRPTALPAVKQEPRRSPSASPPRRRAQASPSSSPSPPRKARQASPSPSPPRRQRPGDSDQSDSPPRRKR